MDLVIVESGEDPYNGRAGTVSFEQGDKIIKVKFQAKGDVASIKDSKHLTLVARSTSS
jgi:hypothetical protein